MTSTYSTTTPPPSTRTPIQVFCPYFPWPPTEGGFQCQAEQIAALSRTGHAVQLTWWKARNGAEGRSVRPPHLGGLQLKPLYSAIAKGAEESPLSRAWRVLRASALSAVSPESPAPPELYFFPERDFEEAAELLQRFEMVNPPRWQIIHYSFSYAWLRRLDRRATSGGDARPIRAVLYHNLESDLFEGRADLAQNAVEKALLRRIAAVLRRHEIALASQIDEAWFLSPYDLSRFEARFEARFKSQFTVSLPPCRLRLVPPSFHPELFETRSKRYLEQSQVGGTSRIYGFVGLLDYLPNLRAVNWIIEELVPRLDAAGFGRQPKEELWIAGKNPPQPLVEAARRYPWVKSMGFVKDLEDFWARLDAILVPYSPAAIAGSGVKMKMIEALASGVPVLTHADARLRLDPGLHDEPGLVILGSPDEWVARMIAGGEVSTAMPTLSELRRQVAERGLPEGLKYDRIYGFLGK